MPTNSRPATVNILAFPEVGVSTVYGMFDMFSSAGRDWGFIVDGKPGDSLIAPRIVAATREPFAAGNGITIHPDATFDEAGTPDVVCVPDVLVAPGQPLDGRFTDQVATSSDATTPAPSWRPPVRERCC
jgi:transcriptional regulator GlxA family with amidase domain